MSRICFLQSLDNVHGQAMISRLQWTAPPIHKPQPNWASLIQVKVGYETWILEKYQFLFEFGRKPWTLFRRSWEPPVSQRSSVFSDFHWCGDKASPLTRPKLCLSVSLRGKGLAKDTVVYVQLKFLFWCCEEKEDICNRMPSPPGRCIPWITVDMFGGTVCSCFWVTGDITSLWVRLDHYDRSLSCQGHHWTTEGPSGQAEGCFKIEPGGNVFHLPSVMWMSSMLGLWKRPCLPDMVAESPLPYMGQSDLCYGEWRLPPPSWPSQMTVLHSVRGTFLAAGAGF